MTEQKEHEHISGAEVTITGVDVKLDKYNVGVFQVRFETDKSDITYKPKTIKTEYVEGLKVNKVVPCKIEELPQVIKDIGKKCQTNGKCRVNVHYNVWNTTKDGCDVTYRFVQGQNMMNKWVITE